MKRLTAILFALFFLSASCSRSPDKNGDGMSSEESYGGGSVPVDSLKKIPFGANGKKVNALDSADTINKGRSMAFPVADSVEKPKP